MAQHNSWGHYPTVNQSGLVPIWRTQIPKLLEESTASILPRGNGRSYGDSCLNDNGLLLASRNLNNFIEFNPKTGVLTAEAGVLLSDILTLIEPTGWFLPVTPGTRFVTISGAIANDVHGKNHQIRGSFSDHIIAFELLRSDGTVLQCSRSNNLSWFTASIGGLGLTGFITRATIQLIQVSSTLIETETIKMHNLDDFFVLNNDSSTGYEYTVSWVDCLAKGKSRGRGHFIRGNHAPYSSKKHAKTVVSSTLNIPFSLPVSAINPLTLRAFNILYYHKQQKTHALSIQTRNRFFYPLDGIQNWNRLYGKNGFLQYQCLIPHSLADVAVAELLDKISHSGQGSFLVVLKAFGDKPSNGLLSFARKGITLAVDFPFYGEKTLKLLNSLDETTAAANGCVYPAKDARMSAKNFQRFYPNWKKLLAYKDPKISSSFWRRVTKETQ